MPGFKRQTNIVETSAAAPGAFLVRLYRGVSCLEIWYFPNFIEGQILESCAQVGAEHLSRTSDNTQYHGALRGQGLVEREMLVENVID